MPEADGVALGSDVVPARNGRRAAIGAALVLAATVFACVAIYEKRRAFVDALDHIGPAAVVVSLATGFVAAAANFPVWRSVLRGLHVRLPLIVEARLFFVSQLGKFLPGAIWPVVLQMETAKRYRVNRRLVVVANLITIVLGCTVGLAVASASLPFSDASVLRRYWWALLALPLLVGLLHPRVIPAIINRALSVVRQPPTPAQLGWRSTAEAAGWSLVSWLALGAHISALTISVGGGGVRAVLLCTGGAALGVAVGILIVPVPAGIGVRDSILGLVLAVRLSTAEAIAVVVVSRVILIAVDLVLAAGAAMLRSQSSGHD